MSVKARFIRKPAALEGLDLERGVVVEASAGTGKTYFLEHLVAELVLERDARMKEIVLVTFTEKAAGELRARVRRTLQGILAERDDAPSPDGSGWVLDEARLARARRALLELPEAFIGTLHQFCLDCLRDVDPYLATAVQLVEEPVEEAWRHVVRMALLDDELGPAWQRLPRAERALVMRGARELLKTNARHHPSMAELEDWVEELVRLWVDTGAPLPGGGKHPYTDDRMFKQHANAKPAKAYRRWLAHLTETLAVYRQREGASWQSVLLSLGTVVDAHIIAKDRIHNAATDPKVCSDELARKVIQRGSDLTLHVTSYLAVRLSEPLRRRIRELHEKRGTVSFDEMVSRFRDILAREASGVERPVARGLRARYRYVLVDEFQDTDDVQWEALRRAFVDEWDTASPPATMVVVGDPKQAIYRFRGADVAAYHKAKDALLAGRPAVHLEESYRSTPQLIDALNSLVPSTLFRVEDGIDAPPVKARAKTSIRLPAGTNPVTLLGAPPPRDGPYNKKALERLFARAIAQEIESLLRDDEPRFIDPKGRGPRRLVAGDICILGRGKDDLDVVGRALRRWGIPFVHYKRRGLYKTPEALDLLDVLLAVSEPTPTNQLRALATVFFPVAAPELERYATLDEEHPYRQVLAEWHELARHGDVPTLLRSLERRLPVMERLVFHEGERAATNLRQLLDELLAWHASEGYLLPHLIAELRRRVFAEEEIRADPHETDLLHLESERSLVTLMTMHAAKGLEFPVVFLAGGYRGAPEYIPRFPVVLHEGTDTYVALHPPDFQERWREEQEAEDARLLYVALTRPQALLYLPHWQLDDVQRVYPGLYTRLKDRLDEIADKGGEGHIGYRVVSPLPTERPRIPGEVSEETVELVRTMPVPESVPVALTAEEERRLHAARVFVRVDSFTSLKREIEARAPSEAEETGRPGPEGHERHEPEPTLPLDEQELQTTFPGGARVGDLVHQILERIDRRRVAELPNAEALLEREQAVFERLRRVRFSDEASLGVARAVFAALRSPLVAKDVRYPPVSEIPEQLVEEEFLLPHFVARDSAAAGYLTGSIDLIFRHQGRTCLVDWKTNVLRTNGRLDYSPQRVAEETWSAYSLQLKLYTVALLRWLGIQDEEAYEQRFGGVFYLYLRGMRADGDGTQGVFFHRPTFAEASEYVEEIARVAGGELLASVRSREEVAA